jgi:hypothetical protein
MDIQAMEAEPILGIHAPLAVFIVGLSGVVGVVSPQATGSWQVADTLRFRTKLASGFALLYWRYRALHLSGCLA